LHRTNAEKKGIGNPFLIRIETDDFELYLDCWQVKFGSPKKVSNMYIKLSFSGDDYAISNFISEFVKNYSGIPSDIKRPKRFRRFTTISLENNDAMWHRYSEINDKGNRGIAVKSSNPLNLHENIGIEITEGPVHCPYCSELLEKAPGRKKKCPHCANYIYVRTRPIDRKKILITESEIDVIQEDWAIKTFAETYFERRDEIETIRDELRNKFGKEPMISDVKWSLFNKDILKHMGSGEWGSYRVTRIQMAEHMLKEGHNIDALRHFLEVFYLDINGADDVDESAFEYGMRPFGKDLSYIAPVVVETINSIIKNEQIDASSVKEHYTKIVDGISHHPNIVYSPNEAWKRLYNELSFD